MIIIREYEGKDKESVISLINNVLKEYFSTRWQKVVNPIKNLLFKIFNIKYKYLSDLYNIETEYFKNNGKFYVAESNGEIIGTIAIKEEKDMTARLRRLFVDKKHRRQRVGQKLLDTVLSFARDSGYRELVLSTIPTMMEAQEFYKRNGFKEIGRDEKVHFRRLL
jgi:ribosomal protein S18 acetylase RimI-like enzyme